MLAPLGGGARVACGVITQSSFALLSTHQRAPSWSGCWGPFGVFLTIFKHQYVVPPEFPRPRKAQKYRCCLYPSGREAPDGAEDRMRDQNGSFRPRRFSRAPPGTRRARPENRDRAREDMRWLLSTPFLSATTHAPFLNTFPRVRSRGRPCTSSATRENPRLVTIRTKVDRSARMKTWATKKMEELENQDLQPIMSRAAWHCRHLRTTTGLDRSRRTKLRLNLFLRNMQPWSNQKKPSYP